MSEDSPRVAVARPATDWTLRFFDRIGGTAPIASFLSLSVLMILSASYRLISDDPFDVPHGPRLLVQWYFWFDLLNASIITYLWITNAILQRGCLNDLASLKPSLDLTQAEFKDQVWRVAGTPSWALFLAGVCGSILMGSMAFLDPAFWDHQRPEFLSPEMFFYTGRQVAIGWLAGHLIANEVRATTGFARLGGRFVQIDLLNLRSLRPFAIKGLRPAAACLVGSSLTSLFWLVDDTTPVAVGPIIGTVLALSILVFLSPMIPLRGAIVSEKERLLAALRIEIRAEPDPLSADYDGRKARFADLVAYYNLVENAREWPIETPTLLRFVAFALLGVGSWLGGALVERFVESIAP